MDDTDVIVLHLQKRSVCEYECFTQTPCIDVYILCSSNAKAL